MNFGGIEEKYEALETAAFVVVPVPYDLTTTYQGGTRKGPAAILEASCNMELYDEEVEQETYRAGIHTMEPLEAVASGPEAMLGRIEEANSALTRALSIAEPEGYVRTFLDQGAPMAKLLASVIEADRKVWDESARRRVIYAGRLLSALSEKVPARRLAVPSTTALIEPLSDREMEVLRLLNTALPTPEIAQELFVSANTIRSHVKSIYGKLNAHGRTEAIQRAKELGLLP